MENIFLTIFQFCKKRPVFFWISFSVVIAFLGWRAFTIRLEEDITKIFPSDERVQKLDYVFRNSRLSERIVVMVSVKDSAFHPQPDNLVAYADVLLDKIESVLSPHIREIRSTVQEDNVMELFQIVQRHLPVFLDDDDYIRMDSLIREETARETLLQHYKLLISPSGMVTKNILVNDPLGFSFLPLKKLQHLQYDENFELYDSYIVTRDHRHLLFFIQPLYAPNDTKNNAALIQDLQTIIDENSPGYPELLASYFGAAVVASGNASQLQRDTILTVSLMLVLLMVVLLGFFRKKRIPFLILLPVVFGALFSLACISFLQPTLSILALAVGAIILGVAVDYSLHYLVLLKDNRSNETVIRDLVRPLTLGSGTTVLAFLCLQFTNAAVLQDVGLFAAFSLIGAALCSLIVLPQIVDANSLPSRKKNFVDKIAAVSFEAKRPVVYLILILTPVFLYFASDVRFNEDMSKLNFMLPEIRENEKRLEQINNSSLSSVYLVSSDKSLEGALIKNELSIASVQPMKENGMVQRISSISSFLISDSLQQVRLQKWNSFWTSSRKQNVSEIVRRVGSELGFSALVLNNFDSLISKPYEPLTGPEKQTFRDTFFNDYIIEKEGTATVVSLLKVTPENRKAVYSSLEKAPSHGFDRQMLTNLFIEYVNADFTYIVSVTSVLVFFTLLISYGRIELALITFVPMLFTWIWILGIMALTGIEFNIVNVMVSTFIFGLGDDYSIFTMDGLQKEYKAGKKSLSSIRTSIFLSAFTTISGLGVLIFAQHPALKSIAAISIIGITCVFIMSQTLEPFFFRWMITNPTRKGFKPRTLRNLLMTVYTYGFFVFGSFFLTLVGIVFKLIPFGRDKIRYAFHWLISTFTHGLVYGAFNLKKQIIGLSPQTFSRASIIISNHSSFMDILLTTMLHPKLILLTNKWVWNSPVFGGVVRLADYYPVMEGAEDSVERLRDRTREGYSVVVFPEGTRSVDGKIRRFHKGAFYIAEALGLPIQPLVIHGGTRAIPKGSISVNDATLTLKFLPPIQPGDTSFGSNYSERTKRISRYFKEEYHILSAEQETPSFFRPDLIANYIYKGPVLEWYLRIKVRLEKDYAAFHKLIPANGNILDLGCGYGFLSYMLQFLSEGRIITGVDYDREKIDVAQHGYLKTDRLNFICADVTTFQLERYDAIIISDVLHYLTSEEQESLMSRCLDALNPGGKLIIRDGDADLEQRHKGTWLTEFFSVRLFKFNKSRNELNFISGRLIETIAARHGLHISVQDESKLTSNVIFVISKPGVMHEKV